MAKAGSSKSSTDEAEVEQEARDEYEAMVESENLEERDDCMSKGASASWRVDGAEKAVEV